MTTTDDDRFDDRLARLETGQAQLERDVSTLGADSRRLEEKLDGVIRRFDRAASQGRWIIGLAVVALSAGVGYQLKQNHALNERTTSIAIEMTAEHRAAQEYRAGTAELVRQLLEERISNIADRVKVLETRGAPQ